MRSAVMEVVTKQRPLKAVGEEFGIDRRTLWRYIKKYINSDGGKEIKFEPKYNARQIFNSEEEAMLADYFVTASKHNYGHSPTMARRMAYEFAVANKKDIPDAWVRDNTAGEEWLTGFLKRHQELSIRTPEATSLARSTAFNQHNVSKFYDNLHSVYERFEFGPENIYNCDETGLTTVQRPTRVIAKKVQNKWGR